MLRRLDYMALKNVSVKTQKLLGIRWRKKGCMLDEKLTD